MDFLKSGIKTVLGTNEPGQQPSPAETVERLVERVFSSTLLDDRRDACRALRALSRKYRTEVGAQGMPAMVQVLQTDRPDCEIVSYALETLSNIVATHKFEEEDEYPIVSVNVGEQFTEMFIKRPEHVSIVMDYLNEYDFRVRRSAIQLVTTLIQNRTRDMQEQILVSPMGVSKLMDLLSDRREVIRNDALLLLIQLTKGNTNIQKIVAFENAFDKLFEIINDEGGADGGIVVEDCLILLLNLLKNNSSNQQFFKEGSYIQKLVKMFESSTDSESGAAQENLCNEGGWIPQKMSNVHCMLQVIRSLVSPSNQQQVIVACQKSMRQSLLLDALCHILMSSGIPIDVLTETINCVAEVVRGDAENQDQLNKSMAPSTPARPVVVVLLMSMINEKQLLNLRCSVLYAFQCFLFKNADIQGEVVQTLLPSTDSDVSVLSIGQLLCTGLFADDTMANWMSAVALMHTLVDNSTQREKLLRALLSKPGANKPVSLLEQCTTLLQQDKCRLQSKVGLLMLLSMWLAHSISAVKTLMQTPGTMAYLTAQVSGNEHDESEHLVQSLCAFIMGLCFQFNDNTVVNHKREDICQIIIKRIGSENFCNKLNELSRHEAYSKACKQPQIRVKLASELLLDYEFCKLFKGLEPLMVKLVSGLETTNGIELTELTLNTEASAVINQYKDIIRGLDLQINTLNGNVKHLEERNTELEKNYKQLQSTHSQLTDQNILLKAQLTALKGTTTTQEDNQQQNASTTTNEKAEQQHSSELQKEIETLYRRLAELTATYNETNNNYQLLQKDQEDLLALLSEQENKIECYTGLMREAGIPLPNEEEEATTGTQTDPNTSAQNIGNTINHDHINPDISISSRTIQPFTTNIYNS